MDVAQASCQHLNIQNTGSQNRKKNWCGVTIKDHSLSLSSAENFETGKKDRVTLGHTNAKQNLLSVLVKKRYPIGRPDQRESKQKVTTVFRVPLIAVLFLV